MSNGERRKECCSDMTRMRQLIYGNGGPGIAAQVRDHEIFFQQVRGALKFITAVGVMELIGVALIFFKIFRVIK